MDTPTQIPVLMKRLVEVMREKGLSAPQYLVPGLSRAEILELTGGVIELPEEVIAFYKFTNGTHIEEGSFVALRDMGIHYLYFIPSLQRSLEARQYFIERLHEDDYLMKWIAHIGVNVHGWIPLLEDNGNFMFIDTDRCSRKEPCIFSTSHASDPELVYSSLEAMLRTFITCYQRTDYAVEDGHIVDFGDTELEERITRFYNPEVYVAGD